MLRAKSICARCPVVAECRALADSVEVGFPLNQLQGVWGNESAQERALRRSPNTGILPPNPPKRSTAGWTGHGSLNMYVQGKCKCFDCMEANRFYAQDLRARRRRGVRRQTPRHGTVSRYNRGCHEPCCQAAIAKQSAKRRQLKVSHKEWFTFQCAYCGVVERYCDQRLRKKQFCNDKCRRAFNREERFAA